MSAYELWMNPWQLALMQIYPQAILNNTSCLLAHFILVFI